MKERVPALIAFFLLAVLVITAWWAADYAQRAIPIDPEIKITHEPDAWTGKFVMVSSDRTGHAINRLSGDSMVHFPDDDSYDAVNPILIGVHPERPRVVSTSDTATMKEHGNLVILRGNAHIHRFPTAENSALDVRSEELTVLPEEDIIKTDKLADVKQGNSKMKGQGMIYNNKTQQLNVFANTDVTISPQDMDKATKNKEGSQQ